MHRNAVLLAAGCAGLLAGCTVLSDGNDPGLAARRVLLELVRKAVALNDAGVKVPRTVKPKKALVVPKDLAAALRARKAAADTFAEFSYSKRKDYVDWLTEAKTDETRQRRLAITIEWLAEGKSRNWKYEHC